MNKKNNRKGFTIVELVIVIAVIAILATVLVPTFGNVIDNAKQTTIKQEAKNLYTEYVSNSTDGNFERNIVVEIDGVFYAVKEGVCVDADKDDKADSFDTAADAAETGLGITDGKYIVVKDTDKSATSYPTTIAPTT